MYRAVRGLLIFVILVLTVLVLFYGWARTSLSRSQGTMRLPGLSAPVEVVRDADSIPHIVAASQEDAFFALGFVHAQDRLWQLEESRLTAAGRLAEVLGERAVTSDLLMRTLGLRDSAERDLQALTPRARGVVQAYSDGINAFLSSRRGALPLEFLMLGHRPAQWTPTDVLARSKLFAWEQAGGLREELFRATIKADVAGDGRLPPGPLAGPDGTDSAQVPEEILRQLPLASLLELMETLAGSADDSAAWVVNGERSASRSPLLAHDRHGSRVAPTPFYLVHLSAPGFDVSGATLPGLPVILSGRNERIAWALVGSGQDNQDLRVERLDGGAYLTPDGWQELDSRVELLAVRGSEERQFAVRVSRNGPLISDLVAANGRDPDEESLALALSWTALLEGDRTVQGAMDLAFASDWDQFREALQNFHEGVQFVLYADATGGIGVQAAGRVPLRTAGDGALPTAGWSEGVGWNGFVPFRRLPRVRNPASGTIVVSGSGYSLRSPRAATPDARRLHELIAELEHHTASSFERMLGQGRPPAAVDLLPLALSAQPPTAAAGRVQAELLGWDGSPRTASNAPVVFSAWYTALARLIFVDDLGETLARRVVDRPRLVARVVSGEPHWCDDRLTEEAEECLDLSARAWVEAASRLADEPRQEPDNWQDRKPTQFHNHTVMGDTLLAGVFNISVERSESGPPIVRAPDRVDEGVGRTDTGPVFRAVYDLADESISGYLLATGQSGNPLAAAYRAFTERWSEARLIPLRRGEGAWDERASKLVLEPRR